MSVKGRQEENFATISVQRAALRSIGSSIFGQTATELLQRWQGRPATIIHQRHLLERSADRF
jgi:hypothetical protein